VSPRVATSPGPESAGPPTGLRGAPPSATSVSRQQAVQLGDVLGFSLGDRADAQQPHDAHPISDRRTVRARSASRPMDMRPCACTTSSAPPASPSVANRRAGMLPPRPRLSSSPSASTMVPSHTAMSLATSCHQMSDGAPPPGTVPDGGVSFSTASSTPRTLRSSPAETAAGGPVPTSGRRSRDCRTHRWYQVCGAEPPADRAKLRYPYRPGRREDRDTDLDTAGRVARCIWTYSDGGAPSPGYAEHAVQSLVQPSDAQGTS
jgi:hypothetical protein